MAHKLAFAIFRAASKIIYSVNAIKYGVRRVKLVSAIFNLATEQGKRAAQVE